MTISYSGERTPDAQKRKREREIAENIRSLHLTSPLVQRLHVSHADAVAVTLARTLPEQFSFTQLEQAVAELVGDSTFLREMRPDSPEHVAAKAAEKKANPSKNDLARLSPEARLAFANAKTATQLEDAERAARKAEVAGTGFNKEKKQTAAERLSEANAFVKKAAPVEAPEPEAVADTVGDGSAAQKIGMADVWKKLGIDLYGDRPRKKKSAGQRLSEANVAAYEAAKKKAKAK
jgi:hypothetical protein